MLAEWRKRATHVILATVTVVFLPPTVVIGVGHGPSVTGFMQTLIIGSYFLLVVLAFAHPMNYRLRACLSITVGYLFLLFGTIAIPHGPFVRAAPLFLPMLAMVLLGKRAVRVTGWLSLLLFLCTPLIVAIPPCVRTFLTVGQESMGDPALLLGESVAMSALLAAMMALLNRFHDFMLQTLRRLEEESNKLALSMTESKRLERELIRIADGERRRLGQEIHDGICQQLAGVLLGMGALSRRLGRRGVVNPEDIETLSSLVEETIDEARSVARGLCPLNNDADALASALYALAKRTTEVSGISVSFKMVGQVETHDSTVANHLYRIAQEALSNALRHANPTQVVLTLRGDDHDLILEVWDDGDGIHAEGSVDGMGLRTMEHRAHLMEGEFAVAGAQTKGTRVSCRISRERMDGYHDET